MTPAEPDAAAEFPDRSRVAEPSEPADLTDPTKDPVDVEAVVEMVQARAAARQAEGVYPPGLEADLASGFERVLGHRPAPYDWSQLDAKRSRLSARAFGADLIAPTSELPGGALLHQLVARVVHRQTAGILAQVQDFADDVRAVLDELVEAVQHPNSHSHSEMVGQLDMLLDRVAALSRVPTDPAAAIPDLARRIDALEAAESARRYYPPVAAAGVDVEAGEPLGVGRGGRLARYAEVLAGGGGRVVDLGCGPGDLLEHLEAAGATVIGVDEDAELVARAKGRGHEVMHAEPAAWLRGQPDTSLAGASLVQVVERLAPQQLVHLVEVLSRKLRSGGVLLVEAFNPESVWAMARRFHRDPARRAPVHPDYLAALLRDAGFATVEVDRLGETDPLRTIEPRARDDAEAMEVVNANFQRVSDLLFVPAEYVVVATR